MEKFRNKNDVMGDFELKSRLLRDNVKATHTWIVDLKRFNTMKDNEDFEDFVQRELDHVFSHETIIYNN